MLKRIAAERTYPPASGGFVQKRDKRELATATLSPIPFLLQSAAHQDGLFGCDRLHYQTHKQSESVIFHCCFQGPMIPPGDLSHTGQAKTVGSLFLLGGGEVRINFSAHRIFQTQHEQALIHPATQDNLLCRCVLYAFDGVVQGIS